jgi:3-oxoacyl-[acyl-carrier protein] reductase
VNQLDQDHLPSLKGVRCLVTGGSRNLGRALCVAFGKAGAKVAFTFSTRANDANETRRLLDEMDITNLAFRGSVDDVTHVQETVSALHASWGGIDVLINNAAIVSAFPMALLDEADWDRIMSVNVKGAYLFSRAVVGSMIQTRRGHILNIGSFGSDRLARAPVHYAASKAALHGFSRALAREVGRHGVAVHYLAPGLLDSGISRCMRSGQVAEYMEGCALGRPGRPEEIASFATWLVSDENTFMTGSKVVIDGGL